MKEEKRKAPKLRFPGFDGDWKKCKLEDISANYKYSIVDGPFGSDLKTADYTEDGVLVMQSNYITSGKFVIKQPYYVSTDKAEQLSRCHCKGGDILIAKIGANFGICNIIPENIDDAVLSSNCMKVDLDEYHDNEFYKQYFNTLYESGFYYSLVGITAQPALSLKFMKTMEVPSPSIEEQRKIASIFGNLDNLITLHQHKLDQIKEYKKGMLQKMFPKKGESVPEVRFPEFEGDWEERKLGDMMNVTSVKRIHQSDWRNSGIRFLRARDIVAVAKGEEPRELLYIAQEKYEEYSAISGKVSVDDLLVTGVGTIGIPYLVRDSEPLYFKDGNIIWFQNNRKINGGFFYYSFTGSQIQSFIKDSAGIGTVGTYTIDSGKKTPILLPQKEEQKKIGDYFLSLDTLITLHQRKLEQIREYKKGLVQQMFV